MGLNAEQQKAVEYLEGPLLVLAGPGTGKTQLLSAKVAYILEHTDTNPENILCITFTDSGASNMRQRLTSMIGPDANDVNIYTYHKFGTNLLERYQNYAEKPTRQIEDSIDDVMQYKIFREIQEKLPVTDILKTANIKDLAETIQKAKSARLTSRDLRLIAERNLEDSTNISTIATEYLSKLQPRSKFDIAVPEIYQPLLENLIKCTNQEPITGNIEPIANSLVRELSEIINAESASEKPKITPLTKWKTTHFERTENGDYRLKDYIANKKLLSLANIMQSYDEKLQTKGWYDFADMIEEAIKALKTDSGFRLSMSERFQYILLDEFQDTNPSQFELIKLITDYENPMIMAVGDDDQAIFEFQGANASNLIDFQEHYHAKTITLLDNYRSTAEILDFSHRVAEQVSDSFAKHHNIAKILRSMLDTLSGKSSEKHTSKIARHEFVTATQEYYWVAQEISQLIKNGIDPNEIAIIAPKHKYVNPLLPYLKAQNINIAYEKKSDLLEDQKIHELIVLARFISELANEKQPTHKLLEILSFPFWQVDPLSAIQATSQARQIKQPTLDFLANSADEKLRTIAHALAELTAISFETPLELWLNYLIGLTELPNSNYKIPFLEYYDQESTATTRLEFFENLTALRDTVKSHLQTKSPKLTDFIVMLDDYEAADANITKTTSYRDNEHAVQIMSAHKSKGLEFKYVFLIAVDDWAWGKSKGNNNMFVLPANLSQIRHTGATDDERLRLLFVAITRSKEYLIMTNSVRDFSGKEVKRLSYLGEQRDEKSEQQLSPYLPIGKQEIQIHDNLNAESLLETSQQAWSVAYQTLNPDMELLLKRNLENYRLTATDLTNFIDIAYAGPESIYRKRALLAPNEPLTPDLAYGNLIHACFEQVTAQGIDNQAVLTLFLEKADDLPLSHHEIEELKARGKHGLDIALTEFGSVLRHNHSKAEVNLSAEHLHLDNVPLTGKLDHININPEQKTIEIYDFKTGKYHPEKWQSQFTLYKYALQLEFYKLLLNLSPTYQNYKVTTGHILFVSPDSEGRVYDKIYDYQSEAFTDFRQLIRIIYQAVTNLDMIKDPRLNLPANPQRTLKDIKNFVTELLSRA